MLDRYPARLSIAHMLPRVAAERGIDHRPILAAVGLDGENPDWAGRVVARARIAAVLALFSRRTGDAAIGLDLAEAAIPAALGPAGLAIGTGRTVGEGLAAHIRQMPTLQGGLDYRLVQDGAKVRLIHRYRAGSAEDARVMSEGVAAFMLRAVRHMAGDSALSMHVAFAHRPRAAARHYEDRFGAGVAFGCGDGIVISFDACDLERPNRAGGMDCPIVGVALGDDDCTVPDDDLVATLERTFPSAALARRLTLGHVAAMLGIAPRSLQRRLTTLGLSFEDLLQNWRRKEACRMLEATTMQVGDVGTMLGYSDPAHFNRAFQRWQAMTPAKWRRIRT